MCVWIGNPMCGIMQVVSNSIFLCNPNICSTPQYPWCGGVKHVATFGLVPLAAEPHVEAEGQAASSRGDCFVMLVHIFPRHPSIRCFTNCEYAHDSHWLLSLVYIEIHLLDYNFSSKFLLWKSVSALFFNSMQLVCTVQRNDKFRNLCDITHTL